MSTLEITARARALQDQMSNPLEADLREVKRVITLSQGDPDLATPPHVIQAAQEALRQGYTHYTPIRGLVDLRTALAHKLMVDNGIAVDPLREVIVTTGGQEAVFCAVQSLLEEGDQLLAPDPCYTAYKMAAAMAKAEVISVPTLEQNSFLLDPAAVGSRITKKSKALLIINPTMPASGLYSQKALEELAVLAERHNLAVISDELYEKILFDGAVHKSFASLPGMAERTVTINGFSKTYCMTGWRVGYAAGPSRWIDGMEAVKQALTICTPAVSQKAALAALEGPQDFVTSSLTIYDERRHHIVDRLSKLGTAYGTWCAGYTILANIQRSNLSAVEFARRLLREAGVYVTPGTSFGECGEGYVRISCLVPEPMLTAALDGLEQVWRTLA